MINKDNCERRDGVHKAVTIAEEVYHDFNEFIQIIRSNVELALLKTDKNHPSYRYLETIYYTINDGITIVDKLLDIKTIFDPNKRFRRDKNNLPDDVKIGHERILVIDDSNALLMLAKEVLSDFGYNVRVTDDLEEAKRLQKSFKPHLTILDFLMPVMNGDELLPILKNIHNNKIAIHTAKGLNEEDEQYFYDIGVDMIIVKPYTTDVFLKKVRKVLDE